MTFVWRSGIATSQATQAEIEVARFLAQQPTPEQILAFHLPPDSGDRFYTLVDAERDGQVSDEERRELDTFLYVNHMMRLVKAEARKRLSAQAS